MAELDFKKLGLKAGLEIHQQLDTHKLFCECPSEVRQDKPDIIITRELRPLAGETGKIDPAALFEKKKRKFYIYEAYSDTNCLVELDDEPPHAINEEALDIVLLVAKMLNCEVPEQLQVMRKTVVNGSNTSGFQRTILVGLNGWLETKFGRVGIENVCLEEDAARRVTEDKDSVTFRLDRLGIPLIEVGTSPDIRTPEQGLELAEKLGLLLRATGKVKRGLGTIRQDVNVSIAGGTRVEIKGFQELRQIPLLIEKEVQRQLELVKKGQKVEREVRNALPDSSTKFLRPMPGAARMYPETDIPLIFIPRSRIAGLKVPELFEEKEARFAKLELSEDLAKQIAKSPRASFFEELVSKYKNVKPNLIVSTLLSIENEVKRKTGKEYTISDSDFDVIFNLLNKDKIVKEAVLDICIGLSKGRTIEDLAVHNEKLSDAELKKEVQKIKSENKDAPEGKLVGIALSKLRTRADVQKIIELIKKK